MSSGNDTSRNGMQFDPADVKQLVAYVAIGQVVLVGAGAVITGCIVLMCIQYLRSSNAQPKTRRLAAVVTIVHLAQWVFENLGIIEFINSIIYDGRTTSFLSDQVPITTLTIFIALVVQGYFANIAYHLIGRKRLFLGVCGTLALLSAGCGGAIVFAFADIGANGFQDAPYVFSVSNTTFLTIWLSSACALDITLSCVLAIRLTKDLKQTSFTNTRAVLSTMLSSTLETFSLTSAASVASLVLELVPRTLSTDSPWSSRLNILASGLVAFALPRFYLISFLYTLTRSAKAKDAFRQKSDPAAMPTFSSGLTNAPMPSPAMTETPLSSRRRRSLRSNAPTASSVSVDVIKSIVVDYQEPLNNVDIEKGTLESNHSHMSGVPPINFDRPQSLRVKRK